MTGGSRRFPPFDRRASPVGLAHRGGSLEAVENSPSAFRHALQQGLRIIETDVHATSDGHAIVIHDPSLDRTTDSVGAISSLPVARVRRAQLANGEHLMTLADALDWFPDAVLNVDVKSDLAVEPFLAAVAAVGAWDRVCAASFSTTRLRRLRAMSGARLATSLGTTEVVALRLGLRSGRADACAAQVPPRSGPVPVVTKGFVRRAHQRGMAVHVWTVNDAAEMRRVLALGVDGIVTDRPSVLAHVLGLVPPGTESD